MQSAGLVWRGRLRTLLSRRLSILRRHLRFVAARLADRAMLQAMHKSFPRRPILLLDLVPPSRPKHLLLHLGIADPHKRLLPGYWLVLTLPPRFCSLALDVAIHNTIVRRDFFTGIRADVPFQ